MLVAGLVTLQPIAQVSISAQEKSLRRSTSKVRRYEHSAVPRVASRQKPTTWKTPRKLNDSDDHLTWSRPQHTGLAAIHKKQPSFIEPPTDMKRAELPRELANPGRVTRVGYIESPAGDHVADASNSGEPPLSSFADVSLRIEPPRKQTAPSKRKRPERIARRQADVFSDADLSGEDLSTPDAFDSEAFGDTDSSTSGSDIGFGDLGLGDSTTDDSGFGADTLNDEPTIDNDNGFDASDLVEDDLPEPSNSEAFDDTDVFADDLQDDDATVNPSHEEELPAPFEDDVEDDANMDDDDVGPVRRPETNADSLDSDGKPTDLSVYNKRNCPEEIEVLEAAWAAFRNRPLSAISLDITPEFEPNSDPEEMAAKRDVALEQAPGRQWRDKSGRLLASGLLKDFKHGRVAVETNSGEVKWLKFHELSSSDLCFVTAWWGVPTEFQPTVGQYEVRNWTTQTFTWKASGLCHKPLYFEEVQLERYGHSAGPVKQTMLSGAHFFGNILFLPYKMGLNPPNECQYALGYYRPGDCAPWLLHAVPISARGALWQTGAVLGGIGLVP